MKMLERAVPVKLFPDGPPVRVLRVEHVIGLKVQAMANAPRRRSQDVADIQKLVQVHRESMDWELIRDYFDLFNMLDLLEELKETQWQD